MTYLRLALRRIHVELRRDDGTVQYLTGLPAITYLWRSSNAQ